MEIININWETKAIMISTIRYDFRQRKSIVPTLSAVVFFRVLLIDIVMAYLMQ